MLAPAGAAPTWTAPPLTLTSGVNLLMVRGTNMNGVVSTASVQVAAAFGSSWSVKRVYWFDNRLCKIRSSALDGNPPLDVFTNVCSMSPPDLRVDRVNGKVYWCTYDNISRCNLDGTGKEDIRSAPGAYFSAIALDPAGGKIYWTELMADCVKRANLDGSSAETIATGVHDSYGIDLDVDAGKVYWTETGVYKLSRTGLGGGAIEELGGSHGQTFVADFVHGYLFEGNPAGTIVRSEIHGDVVTNTTTIAPGEVVRVIPEMDKIFTGGREWLRRADLDGGNLETLLYDPNGRFSAIDIDYGESVQAGLLVSVLGAPGPHDHPSLAYGLHLLTSGTPVACSVSSPADEVDCGGAETGLAVCARFVCTGWSGTGDTPATGSTTSVSFTLTTNSSLTWHWQQEFRVRFFATNGAIASVTSGFFTAGTVLSLVPAPAEGYVFMRWLVDGALAGRGGTNGELSLVVDRTRNVTAVFDSGIVPGMWYDSPAVQTTADGLVLSWPSVTGRLYSLMISTNLEDWSYVPTCQDVPGTGWAMFHTNATGTGAEFYRVEARTP
jgi:hypothetical protein